MPRNNSDSEQESPPWQRRDRKRGIITEDDRNFLVEHVTQTAEVPPDKQTIRDKRYRIRERVKNAFLDFHLLASMGEEDREKIFEYLRDEGGPTLQSVFEFLYLGITDLDGNPEEELDLDAFAGLIERAITDAERWDRNYIAKVTVNIDVERARPDTETLLEKMLEGRATLDEFMYYIRNADDTLDLFKSVVKQGEPVTVTTGADDTEMELLSVEQARKMVQAETEILDEEDGESVPKEGNDP